MAPARKRRRESPVVPERTLPEELLLEIVARSEAATFIRCAAACKSLRREILHPPFLRGVCTGTGTIPPCVLAYLHNRKQEPPLVSLVHPMTPGASSFTDGSLAPYVLRRAIDIHGSYELLMSRGGLVLLQHQHGFNISGTSKRRCHDLYVFDPMTGDRTYLSCRSGYYPKYVLLTAADGIGCPFRLLATKMECCNDSGGFRITVQATKAGGTSWGPVTMDAHGLLPFRPFQHDHAPVILHGGIIHWLLSYGDQVLTYDIRTEKLGTVKLPPTNYARSQRLLGMSPDGKLLRLLGHQKFVVSVWVHPSDGWAKEAVIDVEHKVQSLHPRVSPDLMSIKFMCSGERSDTVLLHAYRNNRLLTRGSLMVLDMETKEMHKINLSHTSLLFEVDLSKRLQAMQIYS